MTLAEIAILVLPFAWPLAFVLVLLFILRQLREDVNPIMRNVIGGLSQDAAKNAKQYAIAVAFGLSASLSAFWDVFHDLTPEKFAAMSWHQYFSYWSKVANPFIVAALAYATQGMFKSGGNGGTNPPFTSIPSQPLP